MSLNKETKQDLIHTYANTQTLSLSLSYTHTHTLKLIANEMALNIKIVLKNNCFDFQFFQICIQIYSILVTKENNSQVKTALVYSRDIIW